MLKRTAAISVALGAIAYIAAVTQRSSMGVASLEATQRFHTTAEQLSILAVAQLVTYAAMQVPVGLLLDRFGPRRLIFSGSLLMALGQLIVAYSTALPLAVSGRMLVGFGDAFTFISMIRLINGWYSGKKASRLQQWLTNGGQLGQIISAVPFAYLLQETNWNAAFTVWASIGFIIAFGVWFLVADDSQHISDEHHVNLRARLGHLRESIGEPATKTAFWTHFSTMSPATVLLLLWGIPLLQQAEGLDRSTALTVLGSFVFIGIGMGTLIGHLCAAHPRLRKTILTITVFAMLATWVALLAWPGPAPVWLIAVWAFATATNSPASTLAFDYTREYTPKKQLGSVNGFVNIAGFSATFSMMFLIGLVLDLYYELVGRRNHEQLYSLAGFKLALVVVVVFIAVGHFMYRLNERHLVSQVAQEH